MKRLPPDLEILDAIWELYYDQFASQSREERQRSGLYISIDIPLIARHLRSDVDIVWGRLFYHLERKYGYEKVEGSWAQRSRAHFFMEDLSTDQGWVVNFAMLGAVLADLRKEDAQLKGTWWLQFWAIIVTGVTAFLSGLLFGK